MDHKHKSIEKDAIMHEKRTKPQADRLGKALLFALLLAGLAVVIMGRQNTPQAMAAAVNAQQGNVSYTDGNFTLPPGVQTFAGTTTDLGGGAQSLTSPVYTPPANFAFTIFSGTSGVYVDAESPSCAGVAPTIDQQGPSSIQVTITCTAGARAVAANAAFAPTAGQFSLYTEGNMVPTGSGKGKGLPPKFSWQAKAVAPTLKILYTGEYNGKEVTNQDVTNLQVNVHAGWPIKLTAQLSPPNANATYTWTIQGAGGNGSAAIGGYNPTTDATQVVTLDPATVTAAALTTYYYTESGTFNASLSPQGENISAKTTFIVTKPKIRISTQTPVGVAIGQFKISGLNVYGVGFGQPITVKNNDSGIYFSNDDSLPTQFAGKLGWAQVYQPNRTYTTAGGTVYHLNQPGLDTQFPYQNDGSARNPVAQDLPAQGVAGVQVTINDKATMWMIYQPSVLNSIWIPIASQEWWWAATIVPKAAGSNTWVFVGNPTHYSAPTKTPSNETNVFPTWSGLLSHQWH